MPHAGYVSPTSSCPFQASHLLRCGSQVTFDVNNPEFKLDDLLALELHKFEEEVGEIVERAQKEEKMEQGLNKLQDTWGRVAFQFHQHKDTPVYTVKMAEEDFEVGGIPVATPVTVPALLQSLS